MKKILILSILFLIIGFSASAHQPRLVFSSTEIIVQNPEISQAFYGELAGLPAIYKIKSDKPFKLYANILVPKIENTRTDFLMKISKDSEDIFIFDGKDYVWQDFYEPFAGDNYLQGAEFKSDAEAGNYEIKVYNPDDVGKYVLAIGETESFPLDETIKTLKTLPYLKSDFFKRPIYEILFSIIGKFFIGLIVLILIIIEFYYFFRKTKSK